MIPLPFVPPHRAGCRPRSEVQSAPVRLGVGKTGIVW